VIELSFEGTLYPWHEDRPDSWVFVEVRVGDTTWRTSLFPSSQSDTYVLPVKKPVRRSEELDVGEPASFTIRVLD